MTIDHTSIYVPEAKAKECLRVYLEALNPLGYELRQQYSEFIYGLGSSHDVVAGYKLADFWIYRSAVDAFHAAAIQAGGEDNGPPGVRPYHANYYAAFFNDPAGNNIEAVCHDAQ
ncbi:hypothetical protein TOPH_03912 [Tolypocladium ophioglossoides CBS 100239]|uniref:VOC domain-containing protein n=1 Tax=Tolypocladium ophioglossoides (strain CBS 100239) TaxID=1163406 RepID=A0A0L0NCB7_TOLOC|nr:hypothetical protein TOPH_03912 [Tolypocladium ophioglossoides CBS 100239]